MVDGVRLGDVRAVLDTWFDPRTAESWDAVGLVCGDPDAMVERVLLAVDAVPATVDEAIAVDAQLLVTHHPLFLTAVHGVPADDPKGALVHRMIGRNVAHVVAHTNADVANPGVSDALALRLGLTDLRPLEPLIEAALEKLVVFVPVAAAEQLVEMLADAGAGRLGDYERCVWTSTGEGSFRPLEAAHPAIGRIGEIARVPEARIEMVVAPQARDQVIAALRAHHPYEEPAFDLLVQSPVVGLRDQGRSGAGRRGLGRVGELPTAMSLEAFTRHVADRLPATAAGVRAAGDPARPVRTVAVCGGSGASSVEQARRLGADAFVTADLKHHPSVEAVTERGGDGMALVDVAHWASEAPWLDALADALSHRFATTVGTSVLDVRVSRLVTDPWTLHAPSTTQTPNTSST